MLYTDYIRSTANQFKRKNKIHHGDALYNYMEHENPTFHPTTFVCLRCEARRMGIVGQTALGVW